MARGGKVDMAVDAARLVSGESCFKSEKATNSDKKATKTCYPVFAVSMAKWPIRAVKCLENQRN